MSDRLLVEREARGVVRVTLNRPELRNAFDDALIAEATELFQGLAEDASVRAVVLAGAGKSFCAGADLGWMGKMVRYSLEENARDAAALAALFRIVDTLPKPVVARAHGAALGGGTGLLAVCDVVIAAEGTQVGTTEVRLGIVPAVISPYVVRKIGESAARAWFATGDRFDAREAMRVGLVHQVVPEAELDAAVEKVLASILSGGPEAIADSKKLAQTVGTAPLVEAIPETVRVIARRRVSPEGQEGMNAFLEKRAPSFAKGNA